MRLEVSHCQCPWVKKLAHMKESLKELGICRISEGKKAYAEISEEKRHMSQKTERNEPILTAHVSGHNTSNEF